MRLTPQRIPWRRAATTTAAAIASRRVAVGIAAVLMPSLAAAAVLVPAHAARSHPRHTATSASMQPAPVAMPSIYIDPALFAAAAKRPPASAPLRRLPQVDLAGIRVSGIPVAALRAYVTAAHDLAASDSGCHLRWWLLAGIGYVESQHAASGGSGHPHWNGIARPPIYGPKLDGKHGFAAIADSDHGRLDGDPRWDRAVGPMQFLPSTWRSWGVDDRGRMLDPQDIRAAALAAGRYLCAGSLDLSQSQGMAEAVYSYNHSFDYVRLVLSVAARYAGLDPNALGVDRLPHDHPARKKAAAKHARPAKSSSSPAPSASASPRSANSPGSTQPSAATTTSPTAAPAPSTAPLPPLPTPGIG